MSEEIKVEEVFEIHPEARYVVVVSGNDVDQVSLDAFANLLKKWWKDENDPVIVIASTGDYDITLRKVSDDQH
jgi:hypothetical protein